MSTGGSLIAELERTLTESSFSQIQIRPKDVSRSFIRDWVPGGNIQDYVVSAKIEARKPVLH